MKRLFEIMVPGVLILASASLLPAADVDPGGRTQAIHVREVTPAEAKAGDVLVAYGDNLNAARVVDLYFTDGKNDFKLEILEQTAVMIRFRVPAWVPVGKMRIAVVNEEGLMLDQPAYVKILVFPGLPTG